MRISTSLKKKSQKDVENRRKKEAIDLQISAHDDEEVGPVSQLGLE